MRTIGFINLAEETFLLRIIIFEDFSSNSFVPTFQIYNTFRVITSNKKTLSNFNTALPISQDVCKKKISPAREQGD